MIKILNENFAKQVRKELAKKKRFSTDIYVYYYIFNESKNGILKIRIYDGINLFSEVSTPIELLWKVVSNGIHDGKYIKICIFK